MSQKPTSEDILFESLTERELEILTLLADGLKNREIAQQLHLALKTVKWYNTQIYGKLGVNRRDDAVLQARRLRLLDSTDESSSKHNLPAQMTAFIGRKQELKDIQTLLQQRENRLITILALGGMGKTRLAQEIAWQQLKNFQDGVFYVELAPLTSANQLMMAIADSLSLRLQSEQELKEDLKQYLYDKQLLLILDNFEHLLDAAPILSELLGAAARVKILVTSRAKLGLRGETVYTINGMSFADWNSLENALNYDVVKLFVQSASSVNTSFQLHHDNLPYLAQICHLTDGMPLAIILASTWVDVLSLQEIAKEIQQSIEFLRTEMRDIPQRHWSIRALFEPTWKRLTTEEKNIFMKFAAFNGNTTRVPAQEITGANLHQLQIFVNKALLTYTSEGRYKIHELLRQYATEQLASSGQIDATFALHSQYFTQFLYQREKDLKGQRQIEALHAIETDFDNIRAVWFRAIEQQDYLLIDKMMESLCWYFIMENRYMEAEDFFELAIASIVDKAQNDFARAVLARLQTRLIYVERWRFGSLKHRIHVDQEIERCLKLAKETSNEKEMALCYQLLGDIANQSRKFNKAMIFLQESLVRYKKINAPFEIAWTLHLMFVCAENAGDREQGVEYLEQAIAIRREIGDKHGIQMASFNLGYACMEIGKLDEAQNYSEQALSFEKEVFRGTLLLILQGHIAFFRGDFEVTRTLATRAFEAYALTKLTTLKTLSLAMLSLVNCMVGDYTEAQEFCHEALEITDRSEHMFYMYWPLSFACCGLEEYGAAKQANYNALHQAFHHHLTGRMLWSLPITAMIKAHGNKPIEAIKLLSLAFNHPYAVTDWLEKCDLLGQLRQDLEDELGTETYALAWEQGRTLDIDKVVEKLLHDYELDLP